MPKSFKDFNVLLMASCCTVHLPQPVVAADIGFGFDGEAQRRGCAAGFGKHEFHFHDIKAKSVSDSPDEVDATNRGGHIDPRTTRRVYRRKPTVVTPLPAVSRKNPA